MNKQKAIELVEHEEEEVKGEGGTANNYNYDEKNYKGQPESYDDEETKKEGRTSVHSNHQDDYGVDNDLIEIRGDGFPEMPTKTVLLTIFLLLTGVGFVIAGLISYLSHSDNGKTLTFLLFGLFLSIPGCYYSFYLIQAFRADSPEEREEILDQIPV